MTGLESARISHYKHAIYAGFKDYMERCPNVFGIPQYRRSAYFNHLSESLKIVHTEHNDKTNR